MSVAAFVHVLFPKFLVDLHSARKVITGLVDVLMNFPFNLAGMCRSQSTSYASLHFNHPALVLCTKLIDGKQDRVVLK